MKLSVPDNNKKETKKRRDKLSAPTTAINIYHHKMKFDKTNPIIDELNLITNYYGYFEIIKCEASVSMTWQFSFYRFLDAKIEQQFLGFIGNIKIIN